MRSSPTLVVAGLAVCLASCSNSSGSSSPSGGALTVEATDSFLSNGVVQEARIEVSAIYVDQGGSDMQTVYEGAPIEVVLTDLQSGVVAELANAVIAEGIYTDLYVDVTGGYLRLDNGAEFSTALGNMTIPGTNLIHVFVDPSVPLDATGRTLLIDFDLTKSFCPVPNGDPLSALTFLLTPHVRAVDRVQTGEVRGIVRSAGFDPKVAVERADVHLLPPGELLQAAPMPGGTAIPVNSVATTGSGVGGTFVFLGVEDGTYDLLVETDKERGTSVGVQVTAGAATSVDVTIR